jgi:NAD-dependent SIR2 family protein deacetylase
MQPAEQNSSFWHLVQALRNKQVVAFVGAGVSQGVLGIPTWKKLISDLFEKVKPIALHTNPHFNGLVDCLMQRVAEGKEDLLFAAEQCRKYLGRDFDNSIQEKINEKKTIKSQDAKKGLETFLKLPFYRIITTNYDNLLLEVARNSQPNKVTDYFTHLDTGYFADFLRHGDSPERRLIFHLHGHINRPESLILAESQYQDLYATREVTDLLEAIFTSKSALFIGFGLGDEDIMQNFRRILAKFPPVREQHFALFPRDPKDSTDYPAWLKTLRYNYRYGIGLIYYHSEGECHDCLWDVVGALNQEVNKREEGKKKPQRYLAIAMDEGFPYARNLWEIISFLNDEQDEVHYELLSSDLHLNLPENFVGTLPKNHPDFRDDFRVAKDLWEANQDKFDGVLVFTAKHESNNYFFCDRRWGGFVSTWYWDNYILENLEPEKEQAQRKTIRYFKRPRRPSIDEYLWHTTVIMTVHFFDQKFQRARKLKKDDPNKLLEPHKPDIGCIFDRTISLRNRLAIIEYPRLCPKCAEILDEIFVDEKDIKLNTAWLRRVMPFAD